MKNKFLIFALIIFTSIASFGQVTPMEVRINEFKHKYPEPVLSKEQMYQDFDTLISVFKTCNPQLVIRKQVTSADIISELVELRKEIDTINNTEAFIVLLFRALRLSQDSHCDFGKAVFYSRHTGYKKETKYYLDKWFANTLNYCDYIPTNLPELFSVKYLNGHYYLTNKIIICRKKDSITIPVGSVIETLNNLTINDYIKKYKDIQSVLFWDSENKCFYTERLRKTSTYNLSSIEFIYNNYSNKIDSIIKILQTNTSVNLMKRMESKCVKYFANDSILYIRLPAMFLHMFDYKKEISKIKGKPIKKVIIDIRGNTGGNDEVWMSILSNIIDKPIVNNIIYLTKDNSEVKKFIKNRVSAANKKTIFPSWDLNTKYNVADEDVDIIKPNKSSLHYKGKIYILQDEYVYSAASSLTAMCQYNEQLVSVGKSNDQLGGRGLEAMPFVLINSGLIFTLNILIDNTNVKTAKDVYHNEVEIPVSLPIEYYIDREKYKGNVYSEDYLFNQDILFKKVLELK